MKDSAARNQLKKSRRKTSQRRETGSRPAGKFHLSPARTKPIEFTNTDKVLFPELDITKGEVLRYYERIAGHLLPHLRDRPMTLERMPDGLRKGAPHFWQKNTPPYYPLWIPRIEIKSEDGEPVHYALVNDVETLLCLVNQGTLTFHPWFSRIGNLDRPDYVLFDLDPGKAAFEDVVVAAKQVYRVLKDELLESFVKTSGKSGLHVIVPWRQAGGYDEARAWAAKIAKQIVEALPDSTTVERQKRQRRDRVYVDVLQNVRGHHAVPPYVLRAVPEATVSTPLRWSELSPKLDPRKFNLKTLFRRLARLGSDPFDRLMQELFRE